VFFFLLLFFMLSTLVVNAAFVVVKLSRNCLIEEINGIGIYRFRFKMKLSQHVCVVYFQVVNKFIFFCFWWWLISFWAFLMMANYLSVIPFLIFYGEANERTSKDNWGAEIYFHYDFSEKPRVRILMLIARSLLPALFNEYWKIYHLPLFFEWLK